MLWKEQYRIGIDEIDTQHKKLFSMTETFLKTINSDISNENKQECINAILFLKQYVVVHFDAEEKFQEAIKYSGREEHKGIHKKFIKTVLENEKKMTASDFASNDVKNFAGMLTAWLIYHVADADQKIVKKAQTHQTKEDASEVIDSNLTDLAYASIKSVLKLLAGISPEDILKTPNLFEGELCIAVNVTGDIRGTIEFICEKKFAFKIMHIMTSTEVDEVDNFVFAALAEIIGIIVEDIMKKLKKTGIEFEFLLDTVEEKATTLQKEYSLGLQSTIGKFGVNFYIDNFEQIYKENIA